MPTSNTTASGPSSSTRVISARYEARLAGRLPLRDRHWFVVVRLANFTFRDEGGAIDGVECRDDPGI